MKSLLALLGIVLLFVGCASDKAPEKTPPPSTSTSKIISNFEKNGIQLTINSSKKLNYFENEPHSVVAVIYQLTSKDIFQQICQSQNGVYILLNDKKFDKSVKAVNKQVIFIDSNVSINLDKLADVRYIGMVAGFYQKPKCLLIPLKIKNKYFTGVKFWQPTKIVQPLDKTILFLEDNMKIKENNE